MVNLLLQNNKQNKQIKEACEAINLWFHRGYVHFLSTVYVSLCYGHHIVKMSAMGTALVLQCVAIKTKYWTNRNVYLMMTLE